MRFSVQGSWLANTRHGACLGLETHLHVVSDESADEIRKYVRAGERACFTIQSLLNEVPVHTDVTLNGAPLAVDEPPEGAERE